ncbi:MAG: hypothetical protein V7L21_07085 [Nostoc sp.]|nr:hypothetical protein [Nostoc sp. NMS9]MBN3941166.1 hypothetical protein [Nostoc sp. NMS9]
MDASPIAQRKVFSSLSETLTRTRGLSATRTHVRQRHGFSARRTRVRLERVIEPHERHSWS